MAVASPSAGCCGRSTGGATACAAGRPGVRGQATVLVYGDYLCPYCARLSPVMARLREALGDRLAYAYRQFPNERVHPGAEYMSRAAEAAGRQGKFWEMHDALFERSPALTEAIVLELAKKLGLDLPRFQRDLDDPKLKKRIDEDIADGRRNGVTATPTIFVDGVRYDGAWDFYSMLEALERPVGARVQRTARAFANLPTSAGPGAAARGGRGAGAGQQPRRRPVRPVRERPDGDRTRSAGRCRSASASGRRRACWRSSS